MLLYSTATTRTIRDGEPRTATSTSTQLLNPEDFGELCFTLLFVVAWVRKKIYKNTHKQSGYLALCRRDEG